MSVFRKGFVIPASHGDLFWPNLTRRAPLLHVLLVLASQYVRRLPIPVSIPRLLPAKPRWMTDWRPSSLICLAGKVLRLHPCRPCPSVCLFPPLRARAGRLTVHQMIKREHKEERGRGVKPPVLSKNAKSKTVITCTCSFVPTSRYLSL